MNRPTSGRLAQLDRHLPLVVVAVAAALFTGPHWVPGYLHGPVQLIAIYTIVSAGVVITLGFAGQFTLGYGAVYAAGAYTSALLVDRHSWPVLAGIAAALVTGAVIGTVLGLPALRLTSHYLGMVTLGFAIVTPQLLRTWDSLTGGFAGLSGIPRPSFRGGPISDGSYYYFVAACCVAVLWLVTNLLRSRWRLAFLAIHDDEVAAAALGVPAYRVKVVAFLAASVLAGLGGALYASYIGFISPDVFSVDISLLFLTIAVVGGQLSVAGAAVGSIVFVLLPQEFAGFARYSTVIYGLALILMPMVMPDGIVGGAQRGLSSVRRRWPRRGAPAPRAEGDVARPGPGTRAALPWAPPKAAGDVVLDARGLRRAFSGVVAVGGVDLRVRAGTVHALIGPNGAGKTTLLNLVSGVNRPDAGTVQLLDRDVTAGRPHLLARLGLGRTFQTPRLFGHLSVVENVMVALDASGRARFAAVLLGLPSARREMAEHRRTAEACLSFVGLGDRCDERVDSLPLGKQRLLEIARALAGSPAVLLLDEPAAGLAGDDLRELEEMIAALRDRGHAVLLVEHDVELVFALADEVTVLEGGARIAAGEPLDVQSSPAVIEAYLGA